MIQPTGQLTRIDALGVADAAGEARGEGECGVSLLVESAPGTGPFAARALAVGSAAAIDAHEAARAPGLIRLSRPGAVVIPGMVNAHTHLDLTHIGPRPHDSAAGFVPWIEMIRRNRQGTPDEIRSSIVRGAELSLRAGVVAVGDIAGAVEGRASLAGYDALAATPLMGVSFMEFFALGKGEERGLAALAEAIGLAEQRGLLDPPLPRLQLGFQPHAPYSVSPTAFLAAERLIKARGRMCTHLAESVEERMLITRAAGPLRRMLEEFGLWTESLEAVFGHQVTPVEHVRECALNRVPLYAHVNDASDQDLGLLKRSGATVAYCPRASAYFGAERHFGPHRYREMLARGIRVALGTDSIVNLPPEAAERGISILDEMRFLHRRDGTDSKTLLAMGTVNGARALGLDTDAFGIREGSITEGLVCVPVRGGAVGGALAEAVLASNGEPELVRPAGSHG